MKKQHFIFLLTLIISFSLAVSGCGDGARSDGNASASGLQAADDTAEAAYGTAETMDAENQSAGSLDPDISASENLYAAESSPASSAESGSTAMDAKSSQENPEYHADADTKTADAKAADTETADNLQQNNDNEKLIYTYHYSVETKTFDAFTKKISEKTAQLGGYIESSELNGSSSNDTSRYADITLRIPAGQMDQLLSMIDTESNITYSSSSVENISLQYVDMQSHIKALRTEQNTLLKLIEKADKLKDIITLQSQLTQVRYEIESYESQLRTYDNLVNYSTLNLSIYEVERTTTTASAKTSFSEEIKNKFSDNLYAVSQWLRSLIIWLAGSLPILIPAAVIVVIITLLVRKWRKHLQKRRLVSSDAISDALSGCQRIENSDSSDSDT